MHVTQRTRLTTSLDTIDERGTKAVSTAVDEARLAKGLEADGAPALELCQWSLNEIGFAWRILVAVTAGGWTSHFSKVA